MAGDVTTDESVGPTPEPPLHVVRGHASPEEVAALFAVLSAASGGDEAAAPRPTSAWTSRERLVRQPLRPGPGAWRASGWR